LLGFYKLVYQPNRPAPVWVPLPVRVDLETAKRDEIIGRLKTKLSEDAVLIKVSKDLNLTQKLGLASDEQCARELADRLFVRSGEADTPMGKVPAIHIGVNGKRKEREVSGEIAMRLMDDVWETLGIEAPERNGN
jgi:hypothetical protein